MHIHVIYYVYNFLLPIFLGIQLNIHASILGPPMAILGLAKFGLILKCIGVDLNLFDSSNM
jgi:hypothetical protein